MRFHIAQLDTSDISPRGATRVEEELNALAEKFEAGGNVIVGEDFMPQQNSIRSLMVLKYEQGNPNHTRYSFQFFDSRNGYGVVDKLLNQRVLEIERDNKKVVRSLLVPMRNDAFTQILLAYVPTKKEVVANVKIDRTPKSVEREVPASGK